MKSNVCEYIHRNLDEEIMAVGGHYRFTDEVRLPVDSGEILYLKGYALFDSTCCGAGGCSYALVQGFIEQWKVSTNSEGFFMSRILPVESQVLREKISRLIKEREMVQQVQFRFS